MPFPNKVDKHNDGAIFTAAEVLAQRQRGSGRPTFSPPQTVIFCYQPTLLRHLSRRHRVKRVGGFFGDLYLLRQTAGRVAAAGNFGVGAPVVAVLVEELAAFGVQQFVGVGMAGGLQETLGAGDLVVAARAIRDEGTSHHYLPPAKHVAASAGLTGRLQAGLAAAGQSYTTGTTWTTDAPYRETAREVAQYRQEGVLTVEMETAGLFAVAQYLRLAAAAAFAIGDSMAGGRWQLDFDGRRTREALGRLFDTIVQALTL